MSTNAETVQRVQEALAQGNILPTIGLLTKQVRWTVNVTDRSAAPWFGEYVGRQGVLAFYEAMSVIDLTDYDVLSVVGDGDIVFVRVHMEFTVPSGRSVSMNEVQVWEFEGAKVREVEFFVDTLAIASAFA
jgi:ketosteroid isomerase-like protein